MQQLLWTLLVDFLLGCRVLVFSLLQVYPNPKHYINHLWKRWSNEYFCHLKKFAKWNTSSPNISVGDIVCIRKEPIVPTKWPFAWAVKVYLGVDSKVRIVSVQTSKGTYNRPVVKIVLLVQENPVNSPSIEHLKAYALAGGMFVPLQ